MQTPKPSAAAIRGSDKTPWPRELMHAELCATRFGMHAVCDCGKEDESDA